MKHQRIANTLTSQHVLSINKADLPPFIGECIRERSLSRLVSNLNREVLEGTDTEKAEARKALALIGFL